MFGIFGPVAGALISLGLNILLWLLRPRPPDQVVEGNRLSDLSVTTSAYGQPLMVGFGIIELPGQVIWAKPLREVAITVVEEISDGGFFGTGFLETITTITTIEYRYFLDFACAFSEGPAARVLKIKMNDKIVYDAREGVDKHGPGGRVRNIPGFASTADLGQQFASQIPTPSWVVYTGKEDQQADALIREDIDGKFGEGSTPAYPEVVYICWRNLPVIEYGNRPPRVEAEWEFATTLTLEYPRDDLTELPGLNDPGEWHWGIDEFNQVIYVTSEYNGGELLLIDRGTMTHFLTAGEGGEFYQAGDNSTGCLTFYGKLIQLTNTLGGTNGYGVGKFDLLTGELESTAGSGSGSTGDENGTSFARNGQWADETIKIPIEKRPASEIACHFPSNGGIGLVETTSMTFQEDNIGLGDQIVGGDFAAGVGTGLAVYNPDDNSVYFWQNWSASASDPNKRVLWKITHNGRYDAEGFGGDAFTTHYDGPQSGFTLTEVGRYSTSELFLPGGVLLLIDENAMVVTNGFFPYGDTNARLSKIDLDTGEIIDDGTDPCALSRVGNYGSFKGVHKIRGNRFLFANQTGIAEIEVGNLTLIRQHDADDDIGLTVSSGKSFDNISFFIENSYSILVDRVGSGLPGDSPKRTRINIHRGEVSASTTLDQVVREICNRVGIDDDSLDLSELTSDIVEGYALTQVGMNGADALEPLRAYYLFDLVEEGWQLVAKKRNRSSVDMIDEDLLGELTNNENRFAVELPRIQEVDLPRAVEVWYNDRTLDYERGVQGAIRMLAPHSSMNSRDTARVDLSTLVITPDQAKQLAERFLWTVWSERFGFNSRIPWDYILLTPSDVVTIPYRGETYIIRLDDIEIGANMVLDFKGTREASYTYTSDAVASTETSHLDDDPAVPVPSKMILLDAPLLSPLDATLGTGLRAYAALSGYGQSGWKGATIYKDGRPITSTDTASKWGIITNAPTTFDALRNNVFQESGNGGTLTVIMRDGGSDLATDTELNVLNGANLAAIVTGGVVEVIHFRDVTSNGNQSYTLEHLLRGRYGTEDIGLNTSHAVGSLFVVLDDAALARFVLSRADINVERNYTVVTFGQDLAEGITVSHTDTGRDLRPYGPTQITATEVSGPELQIDWVRRTRFNGEWEDGTGVVPLNETLEEYTVTLYGTDSGDGSVEKTVTDATTVNFTDAEVATAAGEAWGGGDLPAGLSVDIKQSSGAPLVEGVTTTEEIS